MLRNFSQIFTKIARINVYLALPPTEFYNSVDMSVVMDSKNKKYKIGPIQSVQVANVNVNRGFI